MLDKLKLTTNSKYNLSLVPKILKENFSNSNYFRSGQYNECFQYRYKNISIFLYTKPIISSISSLAIEFNPSHFDSKSQIDCLLGNIDEYRISRIDHKADVDIPFQAILDSIRVLYKKKRYDYCYDHRLTGIEFGSNREVLCIYDKAFEKHQKKYKLKDDITTIGSSCRFELRQFHNKVPFRNYNEISAYLEYNPFKNLEFYKVKSQASLEDKLLLHDYTKVSGSLHALIKQLNQSSNFSKTKDKLFKKLCLDNELMNIYHNNLKKFLES